MIMVSMGHFLLREITRQFISGSCYFYHSYFKSTDTGYVMKMKKKSHHARSTISLFPDCSEDAFFSASDKCIYDSEICPNVFF